MYGSYFAGLLIITGRTSIEVPPLVEVTAAAFPRRLRLTAIAALATLEAEAASAVPSLRKLLGDVDHLVRQFAGLAIAHIEGDRSEIAPIIKAMSLDERESAKFVDEANDLVKQRQEASQRIRENGTENVQLAMPMLKHRNSYHQRQAIRMLAEIGPPARDAVPELKKLLKSDDKATRAAAAEALKAIEGASAPAASEPNKPKAE
jgi:HEAT repeat protein